MTRLLLVPTVHERERLPLEALAGDVVVETCGFGLVEAALGSARALARHRPLRCLLVGLAGTRDPDVAPVGCVVAGTEVRNEGIGAGEGERFVDVAGMGLPAGVGPPDVEALAPWDAGDGGAAGAARRHGRLAAGAVGTVAAASASPEEAARRRRRHPDVLVEEMEGYAVARACREAGVPLSILRAVGNVCGDRDRSRWDLAGALAALGRVLSAWTGPSP